MVIHDCDYMAAAIGAPCCSANFGETRVIALNTGGAGTVAEPLRGALRSTPFLSQPLAALRQ